MRHERFDFPDREALLTKAAELGLELPYSENIGALFEPLEIQGHRLANRFVIQPMEGCDGDSTGAPGPLTLRRYQRFAGGGAGLIWFEATAVVPEGRANPRQLWIHRATLPVFRELVSHTCRSARARGGRDPVLLLQLTHSGRYARPDGPARPIVARHDPMLDGMPGPSGPTCVITDEQLDSLENAYLTAAGLAREAGFDGVDIKACHGYLVSEMLGARERENSRYGGSFENRTRFLLDVTARIRERFGDLLVACRFNASDGIPYPRGFGMDPDGSGRADLSEPCRLARRLARAGCAVANVSAGIPYVNPHWGRPFDQPLAGGEPPAEHPLEGVVRLQRFAGRVQEACPDLPVVGTGYSWLRQFLPNVAAAVLEQGAASLVGVGRFGFAYPDFVRDLAQDGRLDRRKSCTACSRCSQIMRDGGRAGCVVRDTEIYVPEYRRGRQRKS